MPYAITVRDYAVTLAWPTGHHYFDTEFFDHLDDARAREKQLLAFWTAKVKDGLTRKKTAPIVYVWARQPSYKTLTAPRAPRRVSLKSRKLGVLL